MADWFMEAMLYFQFTAISLTGLVRMQIFNQFQSMHILFYVTAIIFVIL